MPFRIECVGAIRIACVDAFFVLHSFASSMLSESDQYRVASDGLPYSLNEFIRWYGVHYTWYWDRAPVYSMPKLVSADTGAREYSIYVAQVSWEDADSYYAARAAPEWGRYGRR